MDVNVDVAGMRKVGKIECRPPQPNVDRPVRKHVARRTPLAERDPRRIGRAADCEPLRWPPRVFPGL